MVARHKADAVRRAARQHGALQSSVTTQSRALRDLALRNAYLPNPVFYLDTPFLIWSVPLEEMSDNAAEQNRSYSWAKFRLATSLSGGTQKFGFYYRRVNTSSEWAVIDAETRMLASGYLKSHAPWTFGTNASRVEAFACLNLWRGWPNDVTSVQYARVSLGRSAALSFTLAGGSTQGTTIAAPYVVLGATEFAVPPGDVVVFEVALQLEYENDSGDIEADFESGKFQINCPHVNVSVLNSRPAVMTQ